MTKLTALFAGGLLAAVCMFGSIACHEGSPAQGPPEARRAHMGGTGTGTEILDASDRTSYVSGISGEYVVPQGYYATSVRVHASGDAGSWQFTPSGRYTLVPCDEDGGPADAGAPYSDAGPCANGGPLIWIPSGNWYTLDAPTLRGAPDELGDGTSFLFSGTDAYFITLYRYFP